jgi:hypothetical protein
LFRIRPGALTEWDVRARLSPLYNDLCESIAWEKGDKQRFLTKSERDDMRIWLPTFLGPPKRKSEYVVLDVWRKALEHDATFGAIEALAEEMRESTDAGHLLWMYDD